MATHKIQNFIRASDVITAHEYSQKHKQYPLLSIKKDVSQTTAQPVYSVSILYIDPITKTPMYRQCKIPFQRKEMCGPCYRRNTAEYISSKVTINMQMKDDEFSRAITHIADAYEELPLVKKNKAKIFTFLQREYVKKSTDPEADDEHVKMDIPIARFSLYVPNKVKTVNDLSTSFVSSRIRVIETTEDTTTYRELRQEEKTIEKLEQLIVPHVHITGFVVFSKIIVPKLGVVPYFNANDLIIDPKVDTEDILDAFPNTESATVDDNEMLDAFNKMVV